MCVCVSVCVCVCLSVCVRVHHASGSANKHVGPFPEGQKHVWATARVHGRVFVDSLSLPPPIFVSTLPYPPPRLHTRIPQNRKGRWKAQRITRASLFVYLFILFRGGRGLQLIFVLFIWRGAGRPMLHHTDCPNRCLEILTLERKLAPQHSGTIWLESGPQECQQFFPTMSAI